MALKIIAGLIVLPIALLSHGYVLSTGWEWFLVPLGMPYLGLWQALGISSLATYFLFGLRDLDGAQKPDKPGYYEVLLRSVLIPWVILGLLWTYKIFGGL